MSHDEPPPIENPSPDEFRAELGTRIYVHPGGCQRVDAEWGNLAIVPGCAYCGGTLTPYTGAVQATRCPSCSDEDTAPTAAQDAVCGTCGTVYAI